MRCPRRPVRAAWALLLLLLPATPGRAQNLIPEKGFYVTNNVVEALEVAGDNLYVGGRFTHIGPYTGPLAAISISTADTLPSFPEANDLIFGLEPDGAGGWFVGGDFTEIGGLPRSHVAHVLPDLTVDPDWVADADNRVYGFAVHGSSVYLHGFFETVGGVTRRRIASVDLETGALTDWDPNPASGGVEDFHLDGDLLYVVGSFSTIAGQPRRMAAFDLTTGDLTDFDPVIGNNVVCVAARDNVVYAGGRFTAAGDSTRNRLAAFDATTSEVLPWNPDVNGLAVYAMALGDSTLFVGGSFSVLGGEIHRALAEISLTTGNPLSTIGGTIGQVFTLLVHGNSLYIGGDFTTVNDEDHRYLAGFDISTGDLLVTPSPLGIVRALAASGDTLMVGGELGAAVGVPRSRLAAFDASTLELLPFAPEMQDIVWDLEANATEDTLYVAGRFHQVDGAVREKLAAFDLATGALTGFQPEVSGDVYEITVTDSLLYLGGTYSMVNGAFRADLASVNRFTGAVTGWNPGSSGLVNAIAAKNDTIFVGGVFSTLGDSTRSNIGAVDGTTGEVLGWGSSLSLGGTDEIENFFPLDHPAYPEGALFVGGDFLNLGIGLRRGVAALRRDTGNQLYTWNAALGPSFETEIRSFALAGDLLYVAGDFDGVLFNESRGAAAIDVVTGKSSAWIVDAGKPTSIAVSDSMVFVGGSMNQVQGYWHTNLAAFRRDTEAPLPASSLVATPGDADKRIDLTWSPSPSPDVKDYLVYRTASAGSDTTGHGIAVRTGTSHSDLAPAYGEWFYRVYSRDEAHNVGATSNEDSAVAPEIVTPDPVVATSIHQNPALSRYADVVVVSDSLLTATPAVTMVPPSGGAGSGVPMSLLPGASSAYRGPWTFDESGVHTVRTSVTTASGGPFEFERSFTATLLGAARGGRARSATDRVTLLLPEAALRGDVYVVLEETEAEVAGFADLVVPEIRIGPGLELERAAILEIAFDPQAPDPGRWIIARIEGGMATPLDSEVLPDRAVVRTRIDRFGVYRLLPGPPAGTGDAAPLRFALRTGSPNPFRHATTLRYDLPTDGPVAIAVFDVKGRRVAQLLDGFVAAGRHAVRWDGRNARGAPVSAGVYFARVTAGSNERSVKMVVLR
jgi:hypothetical protein